MPRRDEDIVDLSPMAARSAAARPTPAQNAAAQPAGPARPWIAIHWRCCSAYSRIYRNAQATAYQGACPRCGRPVRLRVDPAKGTSARFFEAG